MSREKSFFHTVCALAIPIAFQSMLQSSFSVVDQLMIGRLGSVSIAAVGLAGKFSSIFSVMAAAIGTVAGIMISQYLGQHHEREVRRSFFLNLAVAVLLAALFTVLCAFFPVRIMGLYTADPGTAQAAAGYLSIIAWSFLPSAGTVMLSTLFRCAEMAALPLYASIAAALANTGLNYLLIFGRLGFPPMGAEGAAAATVVSQLANLLIMLFLYFRLRGRLLTGSPRGSLLAGFQWRQYAAMLLPLLLCEFMWSLGENVYAGIYGHMGTDASAAMILTNPIQGLTIGALSGLSQAASVMVGKKLGEGESDAAYRISKKLILYGFAGSAVLSALIVLVRSRYVELYQVEPPVRRLAAQVLLAYAAVVPFKVQNMIMGSGIIRSGGRTGYVLAIDLLGTWVFGVPLALMAAFWFRLSIPCVYFILSLEECARFVMSLAVLRRRNWMRSLSA